VRRPIRDIRLRRCATGTAEIGANKKIGALSTNWPSTGTAGATSEPLRLSRRSRPDLQQFLRRWPETRSGLCEAKRRSFSATTSGTYVSGHPQCLRRDQSFLEQIQLRPSEGTVPPAPPPLERPHLHVLDAQADPRTHLRGRQVGPLPNHTHGPHPKSGRALGVILIYPARG